MYVQCVDAAAGLGTSLATHAPLRALFCAAHSLSRSLVDVEGAASQRCLGSYMRWEISSSSFFFSQYALIYAMLFSSTKSYGPDDNQDIEEDERNYNHRMKR